MDQPNPCINHIYITYTYVVHKGVIMYSFMVVYAANFLMLHYYIFSIHWFMAFPNGFIVRNEKSSMFIFACVITSRSRTRYQNRQCNIWIIKPILPTYCEALGSGQYLDSFRIYKNETYALIAWSWK